MPLDGASERRAFHVQLGGLVPNPRTNQLGDNIKDSRMPQRTVKHGMVQIRGLDPPDARGLGRMVRFQIEDFVVIR